ncbi:MAG: imidazolonepropionase [Saprospiraceae bacterium]|nr:imidazolonepropionase [Saprospiraceae bacterium]
MNETQELLLIGPFSQLLTMDQLPIKGAIKDEQLVIISDAGILINGNTIAEIGIFDDLKKSRNPSTSVYELSENTVALPGFIDAHTHICYGGSRANDFAARNGGKSYQEIAAAGGGIWSTVNHTRQYAEADLTDAMTGRIHAMLKQGITTIEVKSGYGLNTENEIKMLKAIKSAKEKTPADLIATCLAAHIIPKDFNGGEREYLDYILREILPVIKEDKLCNRFDIFIEENAFSTDHSSRYLQALKDHGMELTVHGDQFTTGGSKVAVECGALSVDHLEVSTQKEIDLIAKSNTIATALPGASLGLGCAFTPCRKLLDAGACLAIASDWNPGSAPMGQLLTQAAILSSFEKLSMAEVFAGITFRAARALNLKDRGIIRPGLKADITMFETPNCKEILYQQGSMKVSHCMKNGVMLF